MRMLLLVLIGGCVDKDDDSGGAGDGGAAECPQLDCRDQLTLTVLGLDGSPSDNFGGTLSPPDASPITFWCGSGSGEIDGGLCLGSGQVGFWVFAESFSLWVDEGDDAPWWSGSLTPTWDAPYDSEECGHYCWLASETVTLLPCDGCG